MKRVKKRAQFVEIRSSAGSGQWCGADRRDEMAIRECVRGDEMPRPGANKYIS